MNTGYVVQSSRPAGLFSFGLLDGLQVRLRRPYMREAPAGFGLKRLAMAFINNPGSQPLKQTVSGNLPSLHTLTAAEVLVLATISRDELRPFYRTILYRMRKRAVRQGRSNARRQGVPLRYVEPRSDARTPSAARFRILHPLVVFGIHNMQPGGPTGG